VSGMSNSAETNLAKLMFQNVTWAGIGDTTGLVGSATAGSFFLSLHTDEVGEGGDQTTNEATYGGYARVAIERSADGFTVTGDVVSNAAVVEAEPRTSGSNTLTHFAIGKSATGAGEVFLKGALANPVVMSAGNPTASFAIGALTAVFS
jgi:hypothetical protein